MDYEFWSILERGGDAVRAALSDFPDRASEDGLDAVVDLACQGMADGTACIIARGDRFRAKANRWRRRLPDWPCTAVGSAVAPHAYGPDR